VESKALGHVYASEARSQCQLGCPDVTDTASSEPETEGELLDPDCELRLTFTYLTHEPKQRMVVVKSTLAKSEADAANERLKGNNRFPLYLTREEAAGYPLPDRVPLAAKPQSLIQRLRMVRRPTPAR
jgi:hypothetical protein